MEVRWKKCLGSNAWIYAGSLTLTLASHFPVMIDGTWTVPQISKRALQATGALPCLERCQIPTKAGFYVFNHVLYYTPGFSSQDSRLEVNIRVIRRECSSPLRSSFHH